MRSATWAFIDSVPAAQTASSESWRKSASPETPTPTRRSAPGGRAARGRGGGRRGRRSVPASSIPSRARSSGCGSRSPRSGASSSRCARPGLLLQVLATSPAIPRNSSWSRSRSEMSRSNVFSTLIEIRSTSSSSPRGSMPRARSRSTCRRCPGAGGAAPRPSARRARRPSRCRAARSRSSAFGPTPGSRRTASGARNAASRPGEDDDEPARLARVARRPSRRPCTARRRAST